MSVDVQGIIESGGGLAIPVFVPAGPTVLDTLERIAKAIEATGKKTEEASARSDAASKTWHAQLKALGEWYSYVAGSATDFARRVGEAFEHLIESSSQADRLTRSQQNLGVSFEAAARQAGGYVDELEVMNATQALAQRDLRLTQTEVNALARVAQDYARGSGRDFRGVVEQLSEAVAKGGEELGRFGGQLAPLAQGSHTVAERLQALVARAHDISPAAQTAEERVASLRGEITRADRTFSQAFIDGLAHFEHVASTTQRASDATADWSTRMHDLGSTAATVFAYIASSANVVFEAIRLGVRTLSGELAMLAAMAAHPTQAGAIRRAHEAEAGQRAADWNVALNRHEAITRDILYGSREPTPTAPAGSDMVFTADEVAAAARDEAARTRRPAGGGGGSSDRRTVLQRLMDSAIEGASRDQTRRSRGSLSAELNGVFGSGDANLAVHGEEEALARLRMLTESATASDERRRAASTRRPTGGGAPGDVLDQREAARAAERTRRVIDDEIDAQRSFTDRWEEQHSRRVSITREAAGLIDSLYASLGTALSTHFDALVAGRENVKQAAEGIASDVLTAGAKEAYGKAGFYAAEALGRAVIWDWAGAGMSAAASVAYGLAGAGMSALGAKIAPQAAPSAGAPSASAAQGHQDRMGPPVNSRPLGSDTPTTVNHYYAPIFGGRQGTDAEVGRRMTRYTDAESRRQVRERS